MFFVISIDTKMKQLKLRILTKKAIFLLKIKYSVLLMVYNCKYLLNINIELYKYQILYIILNT